MARSRYSQEFKDQAVAQVLREGRTYRQVAESLGIEQSTLRHWVLSARTGGGSAAEAPKADPDERIKQLEAQVRRLEMEKEI